MSLLSAVTFPDSPQDETLSSPAECKPLVIIYFITFLPVLIRGYLKSHTLALFRVTCNAENSAILWERLLRDPCVYFKWREGVIWKMFEVRTYKNILLLKSNVVYIVSCNHATNIPFLTVPM